MSLYAREALLNLDRGVMFSEGDVYETYCDTTGELFRSSRAEYGRCVGKVYVDTADGQSRAVGWVFHKRNTYDGPRRWYGHTRIPREETYLQETWVTVHAGPDVHSVQRADYVDV